MVAASSPQRVCGTKYSLITTYSTHTAEQDTGVARVWRAYTSSRTSSELNLQIVHTNSKIKSFRWLFSTVTDSCCIATPLVPLLAIVRSVDWLKTNCLLDKVLGSAAANFNWYWTLFSTFLVRENSRWLVPSSLAMGLEPYAASAANPPSFRVHMWVRESSLYGPFSVTSHREPVLNCCLT